MTRRECGTCRFFEQSGIGESGYCSNARCRDVVGFALVRRQELACRIGWDQDYYESAGSDAIPGQSRPAPDPLRQRTGYQGTRPDDIIVGVEQVRPMPEAPSALPVARSRTSSVGEAHRRALERRQLAQQSGANVPPRRLAGVSAAPDVPTPTAPERGSAQRPLTGDEGVSPPRRVEPSSFEPPPNGPANQTPNSAPTESLPVTWEPEIATRPPQERRATWSPPPGTQVPPAPQQPPRPPAQAWNPPQNGGYRNDAPPPFPMPPPPGGAPQNALEAEWYAAERQRQRGKRCANCRDYQVAESGDRGWCRNRFAFPTPQLVGPNDLACLSCIGTWWAAHDQWWLAKVPQSTEDMPTPLADELLEELREREKRQTALRRPGTG